MTTKFVGEVHDQKGYDIHEGDFVFTTRLREGSHEGKVGFTSPPSLNFNCSSATHFDCEKVETIVKDGSSARSEGVASYTKWFNTHVSGLLTDPRHLLQVIYTDQNGDRVAHTPNTLLKQNRRVFE
ncbi:uncharacterized protein N7506_010284 [Penicillium brevicompactum]|uniref:uncharacterized protein n=1 Tax=Penicillium brevicompactum TaxID=5074 RepID=UPI002540A410|nr:uncharacterized protein N7506_010284 [Penicillium brevicompactum]KAJ5327182.1 hypothetical protein N7506_010284 [Penicillium brevicompactum]